MQTKTTLRQHHTNRWKMKLKQKEIRQICEKCAAKMNKQLVDVASFWEDTCDVCKEYKDVADISDFSNNYMKEDF